jgi:hypothetical protein
MSLYNLWTDWVIGSINCVMDQSLVQPGETDHTFSFSYDAYNRLLQGALTSPVLDLRMTYRPASMMREE